MTAAARIVLLVTAVTPGFGSAVRAQQGEAQLGVLVAYGPGQAKGPNVGLVAGVAAGRLVYVGLRWTRHEETLAMVVGTAGQPADLTNRATTLAADVAFVIPAGPLEVMPGVSLGAVRHHQRAVQAASGGGSPTTTEESSTEFLAAPGLSAELHLGPIAVIPEVQYQFSGHSDLPWPVRRIGWLTSLRIVVPIEVGRIRS